MSPLNRCVVWLLALQTTWILAGNAPAAASGNFAVGAGIAVPFASSALSQSVSPGPTLTLALGLRLSQSFEAAVRLDHAALKRNDEGVLLRTELASNPVRFLRISGGEMRQEQILAEVRYLPSQGPEATWTHPYLVAACGASFYDSHEVEIVYAYAGHTWLERLPAENGTAVAAALGAGLRFSRGQLFSVCTEARYQSILRDAGALSSVALRVELAVDF